MANINPVGARLAREAFHRSNPFPIAHHFVTERPSVAQNHAQVTAATPFARSPRKISSSPEPLIQALSSHF
jgi:hypothetical protein